MAPSLARVVRSHDYMASGPGVGGWGPSRMEGAAGMRPTFQVGTGQSRPRAC